MLKVLVQNINIILLQNSIFFKKSFNQYYIISLKIFQFLKQIKGTSFRLVPFFNLDLVLFNYPWVKIMDLFRSVLFKECFIGKIFNYFGCANV